MTNRKLAKLNQPRQNNQVDGRQQVHPTSAHREDIGNEFAALGFKQIDWNKWGYGIFRVVPGAVAFAPGWIAIDDNGRQIPLGQVTPAEIKICLDDEIAKTAGMEVIDIDDWMTAGLPPTSTPHNPRPGAEYGVWV